MDWSPFLLLIIFATKSVLNPPTFPEVTPRLELDQKAPQLEWAEVGLEAVAR